MADRGFVITASTSEDVVAYRVILLLDGVEVGRKDYPDDESIAHEDETKRRFDLSDDPDWPNLDGKYEVQVMAVDDAGNTSVPLGGALTLDFVAPDAPTDFVVF